MTKPTLYLMLGYPGAGKTTTAAIIAQLTGAIHLSSDKIRTEIFQKSSFSQDEHDQLYAFIDQRTETLLKDGKSVIYDANLNRRKHRQEKYDICERVGAQAVLVWMQTPKDLSRERAIHESRQHLVPHHETAEDMFDRIANIIEKPDEQEAPIIIDGTHVTPEIVKQKLGL